MGLNAVCLVIVMLAVETGRRLYRGSPEDGEPVEDEAYTAYYNEHVSPFSDETVAALVDEGRAGLARFYHDLAADGSLIDPQSEVAFLAKLPPDRPEVDAAPISTDVGHVPRIEIREGGSAVVFVGVPSRLGSRYFSLPPQLTPIVDGKGTGRMCFDCIPRGLSKSLVMDFLIQRGEVSSDGWTDWSIE